MAHLADTPLRAQYSARSFCVLSAVILTTALVTALGLGAFDKVADLRGLAAGPSPYFVASQAGFLYVWVPLVSLAASFMMLVPGLLFALAFSRDDFSFAPWLLKGFALTILWLGLLPPLLQGVFGMKPLAGASFLTFALAISLPGLAAVWRANRQGHIDWSVFHRRRIDIAVMVIVPLIVLLMLSPKFYWESFNGDGAHALQSARLFVNTGLPFWPEKSGAVGSYPSVTTLLEIFANSWFLRLFGEHEYSVRVSTLVGVSLLAGILMRFARKKKSSPSSAPAAIGIAAVLSLYSFVLAFHASYDPYFADIALPMAREPQIMIAFLGFVLFFLRRQYLWMTVFGFLTFIAVPSGAALIAFWLVAATLAWSPRPWRHLFKTGFILLGIMIFGKMIPYTLVSLDLIGANDEFSSSNLLRRLRFVTPFEFERMAFWIVPGGIVPALALLAWRWQDWVARVFTLLTIAYVLFFYLQAYRILPHHFAPAMIMPLIVYWRLRPSWENPKRAALILLIGVAFGFILARPADMRPHLYGREFGDTILFEQSRYNEFDPREIDIAHELLRRAFPMRYEEEAASEEYLGSPLAWYTYASEPKAEDQRIDYVIREASIEPNAGEIRLAEYQGYVVYARDADVLKAPLNPNYLTRSIGDLFYVPRPVVFGQGARNGQRPVWDLARLAGLR